MIGRTLSHYRIVDRLGAGGMGEVYRAHDEKLGRDVAVKVLPPGLLGDEQARDRFRKEALALSRLSHPHIATLLDFDTAGRGRLPRHGAGRGQDAAEAVREGPLSEKEVVRLGSQLARGLAAAHEHGVIHRDLKPGEPRAHAGWSAEGPGLRSRAPGAAGGAGDGEKTASTDTAVGHVVGTPAYMAPEQLRGKGVDARTDVYGAGACLYELATGRRPFGSKSGVELTDAVLHEAPASPRSVSGTVSPGLEAVILKALDKDPELRYQTAKELLVDLERLQVGGDVGAREPGRRGGRSPDVTALALARGGRGGAAPRAAGAPGSSDRSLPPLTTSRPYLARSRVDSPRGTPSTAWATDGPRLYFTALVAARLAAVPDPRDRWRGRPNPDPRALHGGPMHLLGYLPSESALLIGPPSHAGGLAACGPFPSRRARRVVWVISSCRRHSRPTGAASQRWTGRTGYSRVANLDPKALMQGSPRRPLDP